MIVVVLTVSPPKLRGHLTRWLFEISAGVYVGKVSARVRELLWEQIKENIGKGRAVMAYATNNEQGLEFQTIGQEWEPVDYEGLELILRPSSTGETPPAQAAHAGRRSSHTGWSKAARFRKYGR